jgi:hypothetical protein
MKTTVLRLGWILPLLGLAVPVAFAAAGKSDILPSAKRRESIATGMRLARPGELPRSSPDLASPFNPPDFTQPVEDPAAKAGPAAAVGRGGPAAPAPAAGAPRPSSARDIVDTLAPLIPVAGITQRGDEMMLNVSAGGRYFVFRVGETIRIGANPDSPQYPLEITSIKASEFTVRYQGESKTRPIVVKPTASSK